ncbi:hypothetical protein AGMMS50284_4250 [Clostridia bacterium]|nr:hypothetical protein AGMMS50284_4250 [Clostridia bacterium]
MNMKTKTSKVSKSVVAIILTLITLLGMLPIAITPAGAANTETQAVTASTKTICEVLGINGNKFVNALAAQEKTSFYLGTPYHGFDWRSPNGDTSYNGSAGMNCTGFVWYAFVKAGAAKASVPHMGNYPNCAGGWGAWIKNNNVEKYDYSTKDSMLKSGKLAKGDIIWVWDENAGKNALSDYHHVGIYWGDGTNDLFWNSSDKDGKNVIGKIEGKATKVSYTVVKTAPASTGSIELTKTSSNTAFTNGNSAYSLQGAEYTVYNSANTKVGTITTDANGKGSISKLPVGDYKVQETKAPKGYALDSTKHGVTIKTSETSYVTTSTLAVKDIPQNDPVSMLLQKVDSTTGKNAPTTGGSFANAEFTVKYFTGLYDKTSIIGKTAARTWVLKTNENGYADLSQAYLVSGDAFFTNSFGIVTLPLGTITIQETKAPTSYQLNSELFIRQITATGTVEGVTTYNVPTIEEIPSKVKFSVHKVDTFSTGTNLAGAVYGLYSNAACTTLVEKLPATNTSGYAETANWYNINTTYYVKEITAPKGYSISTDVFTVSGKSADGGKVVAAGKNIITGIDNKGNEITEPVVSDISSEIPGKINIGKTNEKGTFLYGVTFNAYAETTFVDSAGKTIYSAGQLISTLVFGNYPFFDFVIPNIGNGGKVRLVEAKAPLGYIKTNDYVIVELAKPTTANIKFDYYDMPYIQGTVVSVTDTSFSYTVGQSGVRFRNNPVTGKLQVQKLDLDTNVGLNGAVFTVYCAEDFYKLQTPTKVKIHSEGDVLGTITTNTSGTGSLTGLDIGAGGKVKVVETRVPYGYKGDPSEFIMEFDSSVYDSGGVVTATVVSESSQYRSTTLKVYNEKVKGKILINKQAADGLIEGRTFSVAPATGGTEITATTGSDGIAVFDGLPVYTTSSKVYYVVKENNVPLRYLAPANQTTTLVADETTSLTFNNELKRSRILVTKTSDDNKNAGRTFALSGSDGSYYEQVTASNGVATFADLAVYDSDNNSIVYTIFENDVPLRYVTPSEQTYTISVGSTTTASFRNTFKYGSIKIVKTADDDIIEGLTFTIIGSDGSSYPATTDSKGMAEVKNLRVYDNDDNEIEYTVKETNTPVRYAAPAEQKVVLAENEDTLNSTVEFHNALKKAGIKIVKTAEDGVIAGVEFIINGSDGSKYTATTGADGTATVSNLAVYDSSKQEITYTISEQNTPQKYIVPANQTVTLEVGKTTTATFNNLLKKGTIKIVKTAEDGVIAGVEFTITGSDGSKHTATTGSDGTATVNNLSVYDNSMKEITYTISEVNTPQKYIVPVNQSVTLEIGKTTTAAFNNLLKKAAIKLVKTAEDGVIAGVEFTITGSDGSKHTATTGADGTATVNNLSVYDSSMKEITYTISEIDTPQKYIVPANQTITLEVGKTTTTTFNNMLKRGGITIVKSAEDNFVEGVKFRLYGVALSGETIDLFTTTDSTGTATFEGVLIGNYVLSEVDTAEYYIVPEEQNIVVNWDDITTTNVNNLLKKGSVKVIKTAEDGFIEGIEFSLTGVSLSGAVINLTAKTDNTGTATFSDVLIGNYVLTEVDTAEYYIVPPQQNIVVNWDDVTNTVVDNVLKRGNVRIVKTATDGFIEGVKFRLYGISISGEEVDLKTTTDKDGIAWFNNVLIGTYMVEEIEVDIRYVAPAPQTVTVTYNDVEPSLAIAGLSVINRVKTGGLEITKTDVATGKGLPNTGFEIKDSSGNVIVQAQTDENGVAKFEELTYGKYSYREYNAPAGYLIDEKEYQFEITEDGTIIKADMTNELKKVEIKTTAKDSVTGGHQGHVSKTTTIIDTVEYTDLVVGKEYTIKGVLIDKTTGKELLVNGKTVTDEKTFIATASSGTEDLSFTFDSTVLFGKAVVVFEHLYYEGQEIGTHTDITDDGQTVEFPTPKVKTTAKDSVSGNNTAKVGEKTTIIDTVAYTGLIIGEKYIIKGVLMDKSTGKELLIDGKPVTSEKEFTATTTDGTIDLPFVFDSSSLYGKSVVVFEKLYYKDTEIALHNDINDKGQTITFEVPPTEPPTVVTTTPVVPATPVKEAPKSPQTGDQTPLNSFFVVFFSSMFMLVILKKKKIKVR